MVFKRKKIGLALGGGGVRSVSSLGVIENLNKGKVKIKAISGVSMGAIVGALYCYYNDIEKVKGALNRIVKSENFKKMSDEFSKQLDIFSYSKDDKEGFRVKFKKYFSVMSLFNNLKNNTALIDKSYIIDVIEELIPDVNIEDLNLPFGVLAADLNTGKKAFFTEGSLRDAILGTIAIPGIIEPQKYDDMFLSDGLVVGLTPVSEARKLGANFVVAVEVMPHLRKSAEFKSGLDILERSNKITRKQLHNKILKEADLVISPAVKNIYWANFSKMDYCIRAGESASFDIKSKI